MEGKRVERVPRSTLRSPVSASKETGAGRVRGSLYSSESPSHSRVFSIVRVWPVGERGGETSVRNQLLLYPAALKRAVAQQRTNAPRSTVSPLSSASFLAILRLSFAWFLSRFCFLRSWPRTILLRMELMSSFSEGGMLG